MPHVNQYVSNHANRFASRRCADLSARLHRLASPCAYNKRPANRHVQPHALQYADLYAPLLADQYALQSQCADLLPSAITQQAMNCAAVMESLFLQEIQIFACLAINIPSNLMLRLAMMFVM
jgi:hypothetical protein